MHPVAICLTIVLAALLAIPVQARELVHVVGTVSWLPYMYRMENGDSKGASYEILQTALNTMGIASQVAPEMPWGRVMAAVRTGEADVFAGLYKTAERERHYLYSAPYAVDEISIFVKKGREFKFDDLSDLIGKVGVRPPQGSYGQRFDDFRQKLTIREIKDIPRRFELLAAGDADYIIYARRDGLLKARQLGYEGSIIALPTPVASNEIYFAFSKNSAAGQLIPRLNAQIRHMKNTGQIDRIIEKHLRHLSSNTNGENAPVLP